MLQEIIDTLTNSAALSAEYVFLGMVAITIAAFASGIAFLLLCIMIESVVLWTNDESRNGKEPWIAKQLGKLVGWTYDSESDMFRTRNKKWHTGFSLASSFVLLVTALPTVLWLVINQFTFTMVVGTIVGGLFLIRSVRRFKRVYCEHLVDLHKQDKQ